MDLVRFCVTYIGKRPIATKTIESYFTPIMRTVCEEHAEIVYAIYIGGGYPDRHDCDLEYACKCDMDMEFWDRMICWWKDEMSMKVEIKNLN